MKKPRWVGPNFSNASVVFAITVLWIITIGSFYINRHLQDLRSRAVGCQWNSTYAECMGTCASGYTCKLKVGYNACSCVANYVAPTNTPAPTPTKTPCQIAGYSCYGASLPCSEAGKCDASRACSGTKHCCKACPTPTPTMTPTPTPVPITYSYGIVYYSQMNPAWATLPVAGGACNFGYIGCGTTVTAMLLSTNVSTVYTPAYTYQTQFPWLTCSGFSSSEVVRVLTKFNIGATRITDNLHNEVLSNAKAGKKVIVGAAIKKPNGVSVNHVTLIVGFDQTYNALIFNDPLFGAGKRLERDGYVINWANSIDYVL